MGMGHGRRADNPQVGCGTCLRGRLAVPTREVCDVRGVCCLCACFFVSVCLGLTASHKGFETLFLLMTKQQERDNMNMIVSVEDEQYDDTASDSCSQ